MGKIKISKKKLYNLIIKKVKKSGKYILKKY
jgi:hypothetical protein